jgi:hypothetical protein
MDDAKQVGWFTPNEIQDLPVPQSMVDCMKMLAAGTGRHEITVWDRDVNSPGRRQPAALRYRSAALGVITRS